jgi:hypothetical protein
MELTTQNNFARKRAAAIAVLFVGAVAARLFWISQVRGLWGDEPLYTWLNGLAANPQAPLASISPLFPAFVTGVARVIQTAGIAHPLATEVSSILVYVLFGGLLVAPVYGIARRMGGEAIAAGAGLATMFYPVMLESFPRAGAMAEPVYLLLVAAAWYFLLVAVDEFSLWSAAAGGLFVGMAYLIRPEALAYLAVALGLLLVATWLSRKHHFAIRRAAANVGIALVMFALIAGPYLAAIFQVRL